MADEINNKKTEKTEKIGGDFTKEEAGALQRMLEDSVPNVSFADRAAQGVTEGKQSYSDKVPQSQTLDKQGFSDKLDMKDIYGKFEKAEPILSKTERLLLNGLQKAVDSGDVSSVQEMLGALSENPASLKRVMSSLQKQMESRDPLTSVGWESGTDNNGNAFVRMHLYQRNDFSKSAGGTDVTIGSDGRNSAQYRKRWDSLPSQMDPADALQNISGAPNRRFLDNDVPRYRLYEKEPFIQNLENNSVPKAEKLKK